jgi:hypothetical protein
LGVGDRIFWKNDKVLKRMGNMSFVVLVFYPAKSHSGSSATSVALPPQRHIPHHRPPLRHALRARHLSPNKMLGVRIEGARLSSVLTPILAMGERWHGAAVTERGTLVQN